MPPERALPGTPKESGLGEQPRLVQVPAAEEEELLREMEELRSENDYLKVSGRQVSRARHREGLRLWAGTFQPGQPSLHFLAPARVRRWEVQPNCGKEPETCGSQLLTHLALSLSADLAF